MINVNKSRWRELNPRPIPYQGIAIPLSHSGISDTALNNKGGYFTFFLQNQKIRRKTDKNQKKTSLVLTSYSCCRIRIGFTKEDGVRNSIMLHAPSSGITFPMRFTLLLIPLKIAVVLIVNIKLSPRLITGVD